MCFYFSGDVDDSVFIVQSGLLNVLINNADGTTLSLKHVKRGESVTSLLSFIDVLAGNESIYKSVTAKALEPSQVIRLPMEAFKEIFDENPDILIRVIQVIMIRLQRVTFTALRNYLGLHSELVQSRPHKRSSVPPPPTSMAAGANKSSPTHHKRHSLFDQSYIHTLSAELVDAARPDMLADLSEVGIPKDTSDNNRVANVIKLCQSVPKHSRRISVVGDPPDIPSIYSFAVDGFIRELGLKESDRNFFDGNIEFRDAEPGITLVQEGSTEVSSHPIDSSLFQ